MKKNQRRSSRIFGIGTGFKNQNLGVRSPSPLPKGIKMNILCKVGLHYFEDKVLYDNQYDNQPTSTLEGKGMPCILREECKWCGKIRNELKCTMSWKDVEKV